MGPIRSKKTENRLNLYTRVKSNGIVMPSCSRCLRASPRLHCIVSTDSDRCAECIKAGGNVKCDVWGPSKGDWEKLERVERQLNADSDAAMDEQQRLLSLLSGVSAKLARLEKQKKLFRSRAAEMLRRGLKTLDELDEVEEKERKEREETELREQPTTSRESHPTSEVPLSDDWPTDPLEGYSGAVFGADFPLSPSSWDVSEFVGETASKGPGS